jgi:hypothetical protein
LSGVNLADIQVVGRASGSAIGAAGIPTRNQIETHENERSENYQSALRESFMMGGDQ